MVKYVFHPTANLFPLMIGKEFDDLKSDIDQNGLLESIWLCEDKILDGRNRYLACKELGIEVTYRKYNGKDPLSFVISLNLKRRHLTSGQRAMAAAKAIEYYVEEAKNRQEAGKSEDGKAGGRGKMKNPTQKIGEGLDRHEGESTQQAAKAFGTNRRYVDDAKVLLQEAPDLAVEVESGEKTLTQAKREFNHRNFKLPEPIEGKYRVIYADPPWQYRNKGVEDWSPAERHYPTMSIKELCDMPIKGVVEDNAVLFMWVTASMLRDAFSVIDAWGFIYKTSLIWDKVRKNFGYYFGMRHELLLVATKGSCTPDYKDTLFDSIIQVKRSEVHSEKPDFFRGLIDKLYTHGNKIELFARTKREGWESWGNELREAA